MNNTSDRLAHPRVDPTIRHILAIARADYRILAMFLGGSIAHGTFDEFSDLDIKFVTERTQGGHASMALVKSLRQEFKVSEELAMQNRGFIEVVIRLEHLPPFHLLDLCFFEDPLTDQNSDIHGDLVVLFDRRGLIQPSRPSDTEVRRRCERFARSLESRARLFSLQTEKEVRRGRLVDAMTYYQRNLGRMAEAARLLHAPRRLNLMLRYVHADLPSEVVEEIERMAYPSGVEQLLAFDRRATEQTLAFIAMARARQFRKAEAP